MPHRCHESRSPREMRTETVSLIPAYACACHPITRKVMVGVSRRRFRAGLKNSAWPCKLRAIAGKSDDPLCLGAPDRSDRRPAGDDRARSHQLGGLSAAGSTSTEPGSPSWAIGWTPWIFTVLAIGELIGDQLPTTPSRKAPIHSAPGSSCGGLCGRRHRGAGRFLLVGGLSPAHRRGHRHVGRSGAAARGWPRPSARTGPPP